MSGAAKTSAGKLAQQATGRRTDGRSTGKELGQPAAGIAPGAGGNPGQRLDRALRRHRSGPHRSFPQAAPASGEQRLRHLIPTATPHSLGGPRVSGPSAPTYLTAPLPQGPRPGPRPRPYVAASVECASADVIPLRKSMKPNLSPHAFQATIAGEFKSTCDAEPASICPYPLGIAENSRASGAR